MSDCKSQPSKFYPIINQRPIYLFPAQTCNHRKSTNQGKQTQPPPSPAGGDLKGEVMEGKHGSRLHQLKEIFARFDMDSDGSLTKLELAALLRSLGVKPLGDRIHTLLRDMDTNANGLIEFSELAEAIAPVMTERTLIDQAQLLEVFRSFDRDGNGVITAPELARSMAKMGQPLTFLELTEMMRCADADGDGVISFDEFAAIMAKSASEFLGLPAF